MSMIVRRQLAAVEAALGRQAAVALLGPRQVGKTTLALAVAESRAAIYLDLESVEDRAKLADARFFFAAHEDELVILDEIQRVPDLFATLRGVIDRGRRAGRRTGRFLILGSASLELLKQSSESLAGRIAHVELGPFDVTEIGNRATERLWLRGGFPDSFLARDDASSHALRLDFVRTYLERDIPLLGPRVPSETLRRLWTMLAHEQGAMLNAAKLGAGLGVSGQTVGRYTDLLVDRLLVRRLAPVVTNAGKRLVRSPRVYVRDSGIVHALLGLRTLDDVLGHPIAGPSWEGFVVETVISVAPPDTVAGFYRTSAGAEIDLVLDLPGGDRWAIEIKRGAAPMLGKGFHLAREDLRPARAVVVHSGNDRFPLAAGVEAMGLRDLAAELAAL
jgi:predicted AAA+ superfamily ATPase